MPALVAATTAASASWALWYRLVLRRIPDVGWMSIALLVSAASISALFTNVFSVDDNGFMVVSLLPTVMSVVATAKVAIAQRSERL